MADKLHKTVSELLTGHTNPLSEDERQNWMAYFKVKHWYEQQAAKNNKTK